MKKFISMMIVAVLLVSSLSVSAFAAGIGSGNIEGNTSQDVYAKYVAGGQYDTYKVVIGWGDMKFTYSTADETWNTTTHTWDKTGGGWAVSSENGDKITITNHSSQSVKATLNFAPTSDLGVTGGTFSGEGVKNNEVTVGSAATEKKAVSVTVTFVPTGALNSSETTDTNIGKITISLS